MNTKNSMFERSLAKVPGGVHSPVRSFKGLNLQPHFFTKGSGAYLVDTEGKKFIDFCMSFGPLILGHQDEEVKAELHQAIENGWTYGTCEPYSLELAEFITSKIPFAEMIRFVNSGTEAAMTAIRLARGATGRNKIVKFNGCYHGHVDSMLIKAGSGMAMHAEGSSRGVTPGTVQDSIILDLDDEASLESCFTEYGSDIAAVIIEPLPANYGLLIQRSEYLERIRALTKKYGALLIFDEVISGFRVDFGGMSALTGITPDLAIYGKIIGGGLPVGAIAGKKDIMEHLAPIGDVYQAGTLSANPLAMRCGLATLKKLNTSLYASLQKTTEKIASLISKWGQEQLNHKNIPGTFSVAQFGSLFWPNACGTNIRSPKGIKGNLEEAFNPLFVRLLEKGIYLSPNAYEVGFVSLAHTNTQVLSDLESRLWS